LTLLSSPAQNPAVDAALTPPAVAPRSARDARRAVADRGHAAEAGYEWTRRRTLIGLGVASGD
jgi:hypothetical protein